MLLLGSVEVIAVGDWGHFVSLALWLVTENLEPNGNPHGLLLSSPYRRPLSSPKDCFKSGRVGSQDESLPRIMQQVL